MKDEFTNRLTAFVTALDFANDPERIAVWQNQTPKTFGTKLGELATEVMALQAWAQQQSESIAGSAEAKEKEEEELEQAAFEMAQALVTYFMDEGDLEAAEPFRRTFSYWQRLRDQELLLRSQAVLDAATPLTTGANAATIAENYGISAARVATLVSERTGYDAVVSAPAAARAGRKAYTAQLREKFRPVTAKFRDLDRLVPQFRSRPGGEAFVEGWFAARQVINAGSGSGGGSGGGGGGGTEIGQATLSLAVESGMFTLTMGALNASLFNVYEQAPGSAEFVLVAEGVASGHQISKTPGSGEWSFQCAGVANGVEGPRSATATAGV